METELTIKQAAGMLNVPRSFLMGLLDQGKVW